MFVHVVAYSCAFHNYWDYLLCQCERAIFGRMDRVMYLYFFNPLCPASPWHQIMCWKYCQPWGESLRILSWDFEKTHTVCMGGQVASYLVSGWSIGRELLLACRWMTGTLVSCTILFGVDWVEESNDRYMMSSPSWLSKRWVKYKVHPQLRYMNGRWLVVLVCICLVCLVLILLTLMTWSPPL